MVCSPGVIPEKVYAPFPSVQTDGRESTLIDVLFAIFPSAVYTTPLKVYVVSVLSSAELNGTMATELRNSIAKNRDNRIEYTLTYRNGVFE
tara:strand:+ start:15068 stop:15340 length:273 start_codon:yes stop_codon:yes gene_type:complete